MDKENNSFVSRPSDNDVSYIWLFIMIFLSYAERTPKVTRRSASIQSQRIDAFQAPGTWNLERVYTWDQGGGLWVVSFSLLAPSYFRVLFLLSRLCTSLPQDTSFVSQACLEAGPEEPRSQ